MNINRNKHKIILGIGWENHTEKVIGYEMLGTIQRGKLTGALARSDDDRFFCVINAMCEPLNQNLTIAALRKQDFAV